MTRPPPGHGIWESECKYIGTVMIMGGREGSADISKKPPKKEAEHRKPAGLHHATSPLRQRPGTTSGHLLPGQPVLLLPAIASFTCSSRKPVP